MTTKKKEELPAKAANNAVALPFDYGDDAGEGMDLSLNDLLVPFVGLLQKGSHAVDKTDDAYVEGAEAGLYINTATGETSKELILVPAVRRRSFVEWKPDRGGFVAEHEPSSDIVRKAQATAEKKNELKTPEGNLLVETMSLFAIQTDRDLNPIGFVVVPFSSTKIRAWRHYFTKVDTARVSKNAPLFSHSILLGTKVEKNAKGSWFNAEMKPLNGGVLESMIAPTAPAYQAARQLREAIIQGRAQADFSNAAPEGGSGEDNSGDGHF